MKNPVSTFANTTEEVHSIGYGLVAGFLGGFTWDTTYQALGMTTVSAVVGAALGLKKFERLDNDAVVGELQSEPQYACSALVVGFVIGVVCRLSYRIGIAV